MDCIVHEFANSWTQLSDFLFHLKVISQRLWIQGEKELEPFLQSI